MSRDDDLLQHLQEWYVSQCNGDWEHGYGISIVTLDNPGWSLEVELAETDLCDRAFEGVTFDGENRNDWYQCKVLNHKFKAFCGPKRLNDVIAIFLNWSK